MRAITFFDWVVLAELVGIFCAETVKVSTCANEASDEIKTEIVNPQRIPEK
jgi:hypothetical protein